MPHDIIDNQETTLQEHIARILPSTEAARFAVGYFFVSGLDSVREHLADVKELRILIGNTSSRETLEQLSEGYKQLELVSQAEERERYLKRTEQQHRAQETQENLRDTLAYMKQTDENQDVVGILVRLLKEDRLKVRVYTKGRLHAKAYIFDYKQDGRYEKGIAVVGSSNLTLAGLTHNTELNVVVHGDENHTKLSSWFDALWKEAHDFQAHLMEELEASWASAIATPYDIYMKTLYGLVADRLDEDDQGEILWDDEITRSLADFQKTAVRQAIQMIRDYGGAFVADVVGLGKSYIGAGIVKHFARTERARSLIICPLSLKDMWERYNALFDLNAVVLPMSRLRIGIGGTVGNPLNDEMYSGRDFVLIDESHNFRHHASQRYELLQEFLGRGNKKVCLLTATPRNNSVRDVYNQIKLFHPDDITLLPIEPPNLQQYFKEVEAGERRLQDLLIHILVRRRRNHILRYYGYTEDGDRPMRELSDAQAAPYLDGRKRAYVYVAGKHQFFPKRELATLRYSIEDTYAGLYDRIRGYLGRSGPSDGQVKPGQVLTYARYGLWRYLREDRRNDGRYRDLQRAGMNLRGLVRVMLFKRFESSVYAFRETLKRLKRIHEHFLAALDAGLVPAGEEAQKYLYEADEIEETDLVDALDSLTGRYDIKDFDEDKLKEHLQADRDLIQQMIDLVEPITPAEDDKLQTLLKKLPRELMKNTGKVLIFTQYADTARYLFENIEAMGNGFAAEAVYGGDKNKARVAARFAPKANSQLRISSDKEINVLVATDVLSEGLNLQDGDVVVNYDLHWNPVRLIQRFGRIDRIGSENDEIWGFNFLPEAAMEKHLGLHELLRKRIDEIHESIGEDSAVLDASETLNQEAMYAIYDEDGNALAQHDTEDDDLVDINEAEEIMRSLQADDPEEYERVKNLRDGIRSGRHVENGQGFFAFCQAGTYKQLLLTDERGSVIARDVPTILSRIKCSKNEPPAPLPPGYNKALADILNDFDSQAKRRRASQQHSLSLTQAQRYVLRELRAFHASPEAKQSEDLARQAAVLEEAFQNPVSVAIHKHLNRLRRNGVTGRALVNDLTEVYHDHDMKNHGTLKRMRQVQDGNETARIIASEGLL